MLTVTADHKTTPDARPYDHALAPGHSLAKRAALTTCHFTPGAGGLAESRKLAETMVV